MSDQRARITYDEAVTTVRLPLGFTDPKPSNFNRLASAAGRLGRAAIPALMLAARDGRTLRAQLCAIKALGMIYHPTAVEARRRISLLELDGDRGRIVRSAFPDGMPFGEAWDVDKVIAAFLRHGCSSAQRAAFPAPGTALCTHVEQTEAVELERNRLEAARAADATVRKKMAEERKSKAGAAQRERNRLKSATAADATARNETAEERRNKAEAAERVRKGRAEKPKTKVEARRRVERAEAAERARVALETYSRRDGARWRWRLEQAEAAEGRRLLREATPRDEALKQDGKRLQQDAAVPEVCEPRKWKSTWADLGPLGDDSWREQD